MIVLGIDPGTVTVGYGVVENTGSDIVMVDYGALTVSARYSIPRRLGYLYNRLYELIAGFKPDAVAIEQPFVAKNARSALAIGKAQAVAMVAAVNNDIPVYEYTPTQIKLKVTNYGYSSKEQIQEMVKLQLNLPDVPEPNDAADALAVALCHISEMHLSTLLGDK